MKSSRSRGGKRMRESIRERARRRGGLKGKRWYLESSSSSSRSMTKYHCTTFRPHCLPELLLLLQLQTPSPTSGPVSSPKVDFHLRQILPTGRKYICECSASAPAVHMQNGSLTLPFLAHSDYDTSTYTGPCSPFFSAHTAAHMEYHTCSAPCFSDGDTPCNACT